MSKRIRIKLPAVSAPTPSLDALIEIFNEGGELPAEPSYEERMAAQRKAWRDRDRTRFLPPDRRPDGPNADYDPRADCWLVFAWKPYRTASGRGWATTADEHGNRIRKCRWTLVAERDIKRGRRKPMTMTRLFQYLRQRCGLNASVPMKLTTTYDHAQALKNEGNAWFHRPPKHHEGRGNT